MISPVTGSRITLGPPALTVAWKLPPVTWSFQSTSYRFKPRLKLGLGSKTTPIVVLVDFSALRAGLPAKAPEILKAWPLNTGSLIWVKNVATDGEISGSVGARKPLPQLARNSRNGAALNFRPSLGVTALPKSL